MKVKPSFMLMSTIFFWIIVAISSGYFSSYRYFTFLSPTFGAASATFGSFGSSSFAALREARCDTFIVSFGFTGAASVTGAVRLDTSS